MVKPKGCGILVADYCSMLDLAVESGAEADEWIALPGRPGMGKIEGLQAGRTKCAVRYSMEELFWLNATVFCLRVSLSPRDIPIRLPTRSPMRSWMPAWRRTPIAVWRARR